MNPDFNPPRKHAGKFDTLLQDINSSALLLKPNIYIAHYLLLLYVGIQGRANAQRGRIVTSRIRQ